MEEIKKYYIELKLKLSQSHTEKEILAMFGVMIQKHFPALIAFLQQIKLSKLESIQVKKTKLEPPLEFVQLRLNCGLGNELVILNLLEEMQRKKVNEIASRFLKEVFQIFCCFFILYE